MQTRVTKPTYEYRRGCMIVMGLTLEVLSGDVVVASESFSAIENIATEEWDSRLKEDLRGQCQEYIDTLLPLASEILPLFPGATNLEDAAQQLITEVGSNLTLHGA